MPRIVRGDTFHPRKTSPLASVLAEELRSSRPFGQPVIEEVRFPTGLMRVSVLWDRWDGVDLNERSDAIKEAYRVVEGQEVAEKVRLASGITYPEAVNSAMLPYQILAARRPDDPVTAEQCRQAMIDEGASLLLDPESPPLLFETETQAEAARGRLIQRLPGSEPIWLINRIIGASLDLSWADDA